MSLLWRARWRALLREPGQSALLILSLALGVAVVVAVDLVNAASRTAMASASAELQGASTHRIEGPGGASPWRLTGRFAEPGAPERC